MVVLGMRYMVFIGSYTHHLDGSVAWTSPMSYIKPTTGYGEVRLPTKIHKLTVL